MLYYLSLGSNIGSRKIYLQQAIVFLKKAGNILKISSVYETEPVSMNVPSKKFLNVVLSIEYPLDPLKLLSKIKKFEREMGRNLINSHNKPRTIDIDILMAGDLILNTEKLTIPHREMTRRAFVLIPLNEIAPELIHPVEKIPIKKILNNLKNQKRVLKINHFVLS